MSVGSRTWLVGLSPEECEAHLRSAVLGRLGVIVDGRPQVFPVCHVYDAGVVAFPTNAGTKMDAALEWGWVGFEVDGIEPGGLTGWSVMVSGRAEEITDPAERDRFAALRTVPWRTEDTLRWVRIVPTAISGRRIELGA